MHIVPLIKEVLPWLEQGAALTATTIDDMVVQFFKAAIEIPAVAAWLESLLHAKGDERMALAFAAPVDVQEALAARKIDWAVVLPKVLKLLALFV